MPPKGYKSSPETIEKQRLIHLGQYHSPESRLKQSLALKGKPNLKNRGRITLGMLGKVHSEETKLKISNKLKNRVLSEEHKIKIGLANKNKIHSEEWNKNYSLANKGKIAWNKGKSFLSMEKNPNWKGGISFEKYTISWTNTLKRSIRERDNYTCRLCGLSQCEKSFSVHHIDYNKDNCNPNNLITLCNKCHSKTNFNREYWMQFFNNLQNK